MLWPRLLDRIADRNQRIPAALIVHEFATMKVRQPARNLGPRPKATVVRRRLDPLFECLERRGREDRRFGAVMSALIAKPLGPPSL